MASPSAGLTKALNPKHYILAALTAILAAAVVVTVFFVVLSPARVCFSVTNPRSSLWAGNGGGVNLTLTLAANNTSQRAAVWYHTILVDVSNGTWLGPSSQTWTKADVKRNATSLMSGWQPRGSVASVDATVWVPGGPVAAAFLAAGDLNSSAFTVMVTAVARFKVGLARTRLYDINVVCSPVSFLPQNRSRGISAAAAAGDVSVDCVPY